MNKNAVLILHGFFEHKGRHEINAKWFQKLNIDSHLIDLPGHGEFVEKRGSIDSWDEMDKSLKDGFKKIENYDSQFKFNEIFLLLEDKLRLDLTIAFIDYLSIYRCTYLYNYLFCVFHSKITATTIPVVLKSNFHFLGFNFLNLIELIPSHNIASFWGIKADFFINIQFYFITY